MLCLELLSRYRLSPHRATTLGDKPRASGGVPFLSPSPPSIEDRLCINGGCVHLTGWLPASFFNLCRGFSVDIMLFHIKFPG